LVKLFGKLHVGIAAKIPPLKAETMLWQAYACGWGLSWKESPHMRAAKSSQLMGNLGIGKRRGITKAYCYPLHVS